MRGGKLLTMLFAVATGGGAALLLTPAADAAKPAARDGAAEVAANAFLASLTPKLREQTSFPLASPERLGWHFVPKDRAGVSLLELDATQSELLGPLLATALSPEGLLTARGVMKHEIILRQVETTAGVANASRRDPGRYYTTVFGKPAAGAPWAWRFEGHHLSINVTQLPGQPPVVAPVFVGANPAKVLSGPGAGFRLLADEEDFGRELMTRLAPDRRKVALIQAEAFPDILTGNSPRVEPMARAGVAAADMTAEERAQLRRLVELYLARLTPAAAQEALARIDRAGFGQVHFAWAGSTEPGEKHYYRVHGPTFLVEYDNTQNDANHIHTVYRDLERDLGGDVLRAHLRDHHRQHRMAASARAD